ncbi:MAG: ATP-binding protein [Saprospiraceae bacterium]
MITRIEISGFKTFTEFSVDLAPLTVIVGANASGKSNFMDALEVLGSLAAGEGLRHRRSLVDELFTKYGPEKAADTIVIVAELLVPKVHDSIPLETNRLRYELTIQRYTSAQKDRLEITHESLSPIIMTNDRWVEKHLDVKMAADWLVLNSIVTENYINYSSSGELNQNDSRTYVRQNNGIVMPLVAVATNDPHILAVRENLMQLSVTNLAAPENFSNYQNEQAPPNAILRTLQQAKQTDPAGLNIIRLRAFPIAKNLSNIDVLTDDFKRTSVIATDNKGVQFLAKNLSEGVLRAISLATFLIREGETQTLLLEEPETGIDPREINQVARLLIDLTTDFTEFDGEYRQVVFTTHSTHLLRVLMKYKKLINITALFTVQSHLAGGKYRELGPVTRTRMDRIYHKKELETTDDPLAHITLKRVSEYLKGAANLNSLSNA